MATKVLAINSSCRRNGTTVQLVEQALAGAAAQGAETEAVLLIEHDLRLCRNCLQCYRDLESDLAPCPQEDEAGAILGKILSADGVIFASPVHNGFLSSPMVALFERMVWRVCRPTGTLLGLKGLPVPRRTDKVRAMAGIASAGGMPDRLRKLCDGGTRFLRENAPQFLNGAWVGDLYAAAHLERRPTSDADWSNLYFLRKLSKRQLQQAWDLGAGVARAVQQGGLKPAPMLPPALAAMLRPFAGTLTRHRLAGE
jgi:NAD(P)H-dependent FMN reductase